MVFSSRATTVILVTLNVHIDRFISSRSYCCQFIIDISFLALLNLRNITLLRRYHAIQSFFALLLFSAAIANVSAVHNVNMRILVLDRQIYTYVSDTHSHMHACMHTCVHDFISVNLRLCVQRVRKKTKNLKLHTSLSSLFLSQRHMHVSGAWSCVR